MRFERTLVVLKNYLGDTVMASPFVRSIAAETDYLQILGAPITEQIIWFPNLSAQFNDPGNLGNVANLFRQARRLRALHLDSAFLVNRSFRSALLVRFAGIPLRVGHDTEGRGFLLTHRVKYDESKNEAQCYLDLTRAVGIDPAFTTPQLSVTEPELRRGSELLAGAVVGIQPGARHDYKQIPFSVQRDVVTHLRGKGIKFAYFGGKEERPLLDQLPPPDTDLIGKTTLRETIAALANLKLMVGGDTGVMHLAAAVETPTITAFGPTPAQKWGWFAPPHQVILAPDRKIEKLESRVMVEAVERVLCASS